MSVKSNQSIPQPDEDPRVSTHQYDFSEYEEDVSFDPETLYLFLTGVTTSEPTIDNIIAAFEAQLHDLPELAAEEIRMEYTIPTPDELSSSGSLSSSEGESESSEHRNSRDPVAVFVRNYISHYTVQEEHPPLGTTTSTENDEGTDQQSESTVRPMAMAIYPGSHLQTNIGTPDEAVTTPVLGGLATAGYRTGRSITRLFSAAWNRLTSPVTSQTSVNSPSASDTPPRNTDESATHE